MPFYFKGVLCSLFFRGRGVSESIPCCFRAVGLQIHPRYLLGFLQGEAIQAGDPNLGPAPCHSDSLPVTVGGSLYRASKIRITGSNDRLSRGLSPDVLL